jgi:SagB-type dehydrogenase family enzyme
MVSMNGLESPDALAEVSLPNGTEPSMRLSLCLRRRRSRRTYTGDAMELKSLATLLRAGSGITGHAKAPLSRDPSNVVDIPFRSAPSPGGLYGVDLYVSVQHVSGLERGLYLYSSRHDKLFLLRRDGDEQVLRRIKDACTYPDQLIMHSRACIMLFLVGRPWKVMRKYGDRGIRYMFIEAGEITENVHLAATALGFGSVESASFYDNEINSALGVDGATATVLHMVLVGHAADSSK